MRKLTTAGIVLITTALTAPARAQFGPENAAMGVLDEFMAALNARDDEAMCRTFHYPHVRFASGAVRTYETDEDCVEQFDFARFAERFGWDHSGWDSRTVVQANADKVHVMVVFSRYDADDELLAQFDSLYIVTRVDGRWGIRARSSYAPLQGAETERSGCSLSLWERAGVLSRATRASTCMPACGCRPDAETRSAAADVHPLDAAVTPMATASEGTLPTLSCS